MSLFRIKEQNKMKKVIFLKEAFSSHPTYGISTTYEITTPVFNDSTNNMKQGDSASKPESSRSLITAGRGQMGDSKLPKLHYEMEEAFENFLLRLDDIFLTLIRDGSKERNCSDFLDYKDICEKIRTETLIALDRLELIIMPKNNLTGKKAVFLEKLNKIKLQLSTLRWQYHKAIKELGSR